MQAASMSCMVMSITTAFCEVASDAGQIALAGSVFLTDFANGGLTAGFGFRKRLVFSDAAADFSEAFFMFEVEAFSDVFFGVPSDSFIDFIAGLFTFEVEAVMVLEGLDMIK